MSLKLAKTCVAAFSVTIAFGVLQARAQPAGSAAQPSAQATGGSPDTFENWTAMPLSQPKDFGNWRGETWAQYRRKCWDLFHGPSSDRLLMQDCMHWMNIGPHEVSPPLDSRRSADTRKAA